MVQAAALLALLGMIGLIFWLGGGQFGRAQTQAWIDRVKGVPWLYRFLDYHHGKFRAASHYFEFGGLFFILYWVYDIFLGSGVYAFRAVPAILIALVCAAGAILDEWHQLKSGTRQFRRVDFLHSCCGISIAMAVVFYQSLWRGVE